MEIFKRDLTLQDKILDYLREGEDSISGIHRKLERDGYKLHRLVLTGYLKALADVGILKEHEIKPSKVYSWRSKVKKRSIYEIVGEKVKKLSDSKAEQARLAVYILQRLFKRAIFLEEVKRCGIDVDDIDARKVGGEERIQARKVLSNTFVKLPYNNPAYIVEETKGMKDIYEDVLEEIVLQLLNAKKFVFRGKQLKLD
ncbi:MAG TPA: hypothetical protein ENF40_00615 [Thermoplasmatales archaeon]|nr:hypothetical protein [Thermoplasmatales archaeon]